VVDQVQLIGRASFGGDLLPAKVVQANKIAYVAYEKAEHQVKSCEVYFFSSNF
jgi:hypothetical protein